MIQSYSSSCCVFHECCEKVGKGKVRIVIELGVLKSWERKRVGLHDQHDNKEEEVKEEELEGKVTGTLEFWAGDYE